MRKTRKKMSIREFEPLTIIGRGAFGEVRICRQKSTGAIVAVKKMRKEEMLKKNQLMHVRTEKEIMTANNPWIVNLKYSFQDEYYLYLVMDYLPGGDLMNLLMKRDILTEDGQIPNMEKAMLSDAVATMSGAVCGTSTVTTVAESASGIVGGGRTGLAAIVSAFMILIAMFLSPVAQLIPNCATAPALIYVGVLMISSIKGIDWKSVDIAAPAFMTFAMMPLSYNISYGIAFGIITYVIVNLFTGKAKEVKISTWIIALLFVAMLVLTH